jgi:hypothetical protein
VTAAWVGALLSAFVARKGMAWNSHGRSNEEMVDALESEPRGSHTIWKVILILCNL